jgi:hypothetical protein
MATPATARVRLPLNRWIADMIRLLVGLPAEPGPIRLAPCMIEIADVIVDRAVERVALKQAIGPESE